MITFEQACKIVDALERPQWEGPGTFHIASEGKENADYYWVDWGAKEAADDSDYMALSSTITLVRKSDGTVRQLHFAEPDDHVLFDAMTPVRQDANV